MQKPLIAWSSPDNYKYVILFFFYTVLSSQVS